MSTRLKILHTSDWHLGRRLYGHTRYDEFSAFLDWLYGCIIKQKIDVLIVAGDIFDTMTPSNKAQALYYEFLGKISNSSCQHVIIVAGNHDSPSLLDAPKDILKFLDVHIIGTACDDIADEVITLRNKHNQPQCIIMAVPYLRDKDVRQTSSGESSTDKQQQLVVGIANHYQQAADIAKDIQASCSYTSPSSSKQPIKQNQQLTLQNVDDILENKPSDTQKIPIIATGHLMAVGGKTTTDDGVRDLYVGSLGGVSATIFDDAIDYVALGHLHVPQLVGGHEHIRYSGSPIAMGFGEAKQQKQVLVIEFTESEKIISSIKVPCFHKLIAIKGDMQYITEQIEQLKQLDEAIWIEITYTANDIIVNLREQINQMVIDSKLDVINIKNPKNYQRVLNQSEQSESLDELTHHDVFVKCLETHDINDSNKTMLTNCFQEIVYEIEHEDVKAE